MSSSENFVSTYIENPFVKENKFINAQVQTDLLPSFERAKNILPEPFWENNQDVINCYWKAWELAFKNLRNASQESGFVADFIDAAFNDHIFMWDSIFMLRFGLYGRRVFDFQSSLNNFYCKQHPDGFICREISQINGSDCFSRFDPSSTGPNLLAWSEWEYYKHTHDTNRLEKVFPSILAYHQWLKNNRTWKDGSYFSSGWGCGMDNQPRLPEDRNFEFNQMYDHGHMSWIDTTIQQILSAKLILKIADELGLADKISNLKVEAAYLSDFINQKMWNDKESFYFDLFRDGSLGTAKTIGAYWAMLADIIPSEKINSFIAHLTDPKEFARPHPVPTLSADNTHYHPYGFYWLGGVWAPTNYMVLKGLLSLGEDKLAFAIAEKHHKSVVDVFKDTGTLWENYAPEHIAQGNSSRPDFVGWTGLVPIAVLFEYIFGITPLPEQNKIIWNIRQKQNHGVKRYPFGPDGLVDLRCREISDNHEFPDVEISANINLQVELRYLNTSKIITVKPE